MFSSDQFVLSDKYISSLIRDNFFYFIHMNLTKFFFARSLLTQSTF